MITQTKRVNIFEAVKEDISDIIAMEEHKDNRDFIWIGTFEEHMDEINDPNHMLLLFRAKDDNRILGYALIHIDFKSHVFELRRFVITEKSCGYGRETIKELIRYAFEELDINRFWLDVYPDNEKGINLYESLGMHRDGELRQSYKSERGYLNQIIYSILREEYKQCIQD